MRLLRTCRGRQDVDEATELRQAAEDVKVVETAVSIWSSLCRVRSRESSLAT